MIVSALLAAFAYSSATPSFAAEQSRITPPLHTTSYQILDAKNHAVRLPWANQTLEKNPAVPDYAVKANPQFHGKHAMEIMDAVIAALAKARIMVILDNHVGRADWCCKDDDGNGLWYNDDYPEEKWLADWRTIVLRYKGQPWVVGADLRNELRSGAAWGGNDRRLDWQAAAERGGNTVLDANPNLLVMLEGPQYDRFHGLRSNAAYAKSSQSSRLFAARLRFRFAHLHQLRRNAAGL